MVATWLILALVAALIYWLFSRNRSVAVAKASQLDAVVATLGPPIAGTIADIETLGHSSRGLRGIYHGYDVAAWFEFSPHVDLYGGSHPTCSFHLMADDIDGSRLWQASYAHLLHGDRWRFDATDDDLRERLEKAGLLNACAALAGVGASMTYYLPQRRILVGWPYQPGEAWPSNAEFETRLALLERIILINRETNVPAQPTGATPP